MTALRIDNAADAVAVVPHLIGYYPEQGQTVALLCGASGSLTVAAAYTPADPAATGAELGRFCAEVNPHRVTLVTYGAAAEQDSDLIVRIAAMTYPSLANHLVAIAVDDDHLRLNDDGQWHDIFPQRTIDLASLQLAVGRVAPNRAARLEQTSVLDPTWAPPSSADAARLLSHRPSERATEGRRLLTQLSQEKIPDPESMGKLAVILASDSACRDALIVDAATSVPKADILVQMFRGAPDAHRDQIGPAAAQASYLATGSSITARHILDQIDIRDSLADLVHKLLESRIPPHLVKDALLGAPPHEDLAQADAHHDATLKARARHLLDPAAPPPSHRATTTPGIHKEIDPPSR